MRFRDAGTVDRKQLLSLLGLCLLAAWFIAPLWAPGFPLDGDWARVINGWAAGEDCAPGELHVWDPRFEGGCPLSGHPCAGFTSFWVQIFALPATGALRLFLSLMTLLCAFSTLAYLRERLGLPHALSAFGAAALVSSSWWRGRLLGGDVELSSMLLLPLTLYLLTFSGEGRRSRLALIAAAALGFPAMATGKPDWWVSALCLLVLALVTRGNPSPGLPPPKRVLPFLLLGLAFTAPRLASLWEGLVWVKTQQAEADRGPWAEQARKRGLERPDWTHWRHPPVVSKAALRPEGSREAAFPGGPPIPGFVERIPMAVLVASSLPALSRRRHVVLLGAALLFWCSDPLQIFGVGLEIPRPYAGPPLIFRPRYLAFPLEFLLVIAACFGARRLARNRPRLCCFLCCATLLLQLHGWSDASRCLFGPRPELPLLPDSDPLALVTMDRRLEGETHPLRTLAARALGVGTLGLDRWVPFPHPVEERWILRSDRYEINPQWTGHVRSMEGGVDEACLLSARTNALLLHLRASGAGALVLNLLHAPGLRCRPGRVKREGNLLKLEFDGAYEGLVELRFGPTALESGAMTLSALSLLGALAWAMVKRDSRP